MVPTDAENIRRLVHYSFVSSFPCSKGGFQRGIGQVVHKQECQCCADGSRTPARFPGLDTGDTQLCFSDPVEAAHARDRKLKIAKSKDRTGPAASKYSIFDGSSSSYADNPAAPGSLAPFRTLQWSLREEIAIVCPAKTLTIAYDSEYKAFVFPKEVGALK